ncbi:MAG: type II secretion system F family protein, partial [bacterium]|nr:type II secretion system F family protein [bacterium]
MPKYNYKAKDKGGEQQLGVVEAPTKDGAASILSSHELFILSLEEVRDKRFYDRLLSYFGRVKGEDMVVFSRQLSTLLEARIALPDALRTLYEQTANERLKAAIAEIGESIDSGLSFSQAIEHHPDLFSNFFISMVRSAEVTGGLEKTAGFLADYLEKEAILIQKARGAMVYPIVVIGLFVAVAVIMLVFVLPQIEPIFVQAGVDLPLLTRILMGTGRFITKWWFFVILGFGGLFIALLDYIKTPEGKALADEAKIKTPLIKKIYVPLTLTRLGNTMYMLLRGGVPMTQAIQIAS